MGFLLARYDLLTPETCSNLSSMIVNVLQPCLMFNRIITSLDSSDLKTIGVIILTGFLYQFIGLFAAFVGRLVLPVPKFWFGSFILACVFSNTTDLPVAYVTTLSGAHPFTAADGARGTAYAMVFVATFIFTMFSMGGYKLVIHDTQKKEEAMKKGTYKEYALSSPAVFDVLELVKRFTGLFFKKEHDDSASSSAKPIKLKPFNSLIPGEKSKPSSSKEPHHLHSSPLLVGSKEPPVDEPESVLVVFQDRVRADTVKSDSDAASGEIREITEFRLNDGECMSRVEQLQSELKRVTSCRSVQSLQSIESDHSVHPIHSAQPNQNNNLNSTMLRKQSTRTSVFSIAQSCHSVPSHVIFPHESDQENDETSSLKESCSKPMNKISQFIEDHFFLRKILIPFLSNLARPPSITLVVSLIITMVPSLRALFYTSPSAHTNIPLAPDGQPVLSFIMDLTSFVGASQVPFGMLLLGACISRLKIGSLPRRYYSVVLYLAIFKLVILPIIAVIWTVYLQKVGWIGKQSSTSNQTTTPGENPITGLMLILTSGSPIATLQVLFISMFSKPVVQVVEERNEDGELVSQKQVFRHQELDYLAACLIFQYSVLFLSMSILITYTLKAVLHV